MPLILMARWKAPRRSLSNSDDPRPAYSARIRRESPRVHDYLAGSAQARQTGRPRVTGQTGQSEDTHSPDECARVVVSLDQPGTLIN
jgi:hypothetical protein